MVETTLKSTTAEEVIRRYKDLQLIERAFRCLKSSLRLRPVHHWTEKRIRAHVFLCVLALQVERYMQTHLEDVPFSVQSALGKLKNVKAGQLSPNEAKTPILTTATEEQKEIYKQLKLSLININRLQ